jgi:hypothetical protein
MMLNNFCGGHRCSIIYLLSYNVMSLNREKKLLRHLHRKLMSRIITFILLFLINY